MNHINAVAATCALISLTGSVHARTIVEDFLDGMGGAAYDAELDYAFNTGDFWDLFPGELNLYPATANITVNSLVAGEYIESVEVVWTDFCGLGCTSLEIYGASSSATQFNTSVSTQETWTLSTADIGEEILGFSLHSLRVVLSGSRSTSCPHPPAPRCCLVVWSRCVVAADYQILYASEQSNPRCHQRGLCSLILIEGDAQQELGPVPASADQLQVSTHFSCEPA